MYFIFSDADRLEVLRQLNGLAPAGRREPLAAALRRRKLRHRIIACTQL